MCHGVDDSDLLTLIMINGLKSRKLAKGKRAEAFVNYRLLRALKAI